MPHDHRARPPARGVKGPGRVDALPRPAELLLRRRGHHGGIPGRVPDELHVHARRFRQALSDRRFRRLGNVCVQRTGPRRHRQRDVHLGAAHVDALHQSEIDHVDADLRIHDTTQRFSNLVFRHIASL